MNESSALLAAFGWALLHFIWQGAAIAFGLAIGNMLLSRAQPHLRYGLACAALAIMVLCIPVTVYLTSSAASGKASLQLSAPVNRGDSHGAPVPASVPSEAARVDSAISSIDSTQPNSPAPLASPVGASLISAPHSLTMLNLRAELGSRIHFLPVLWLCGAVLFSLRFMFGILGILRLRRATTQCDSPELVQAITRLAQRLELTQKLDVRWCMMAPAPMVYGFIRPILLLPVSAFTGLTPVQIETLLAHELAHIRRHDYLVNLVQTFVETLLFYHPAVWWVSRQIRTEREHVCDELAVAACNGNRLALATALSHLEELRGGYFLAPAASNHPLLQRIRRLTMGSNVGRSPFIGVFVLFTIVGICISGAVLYATTTHTQQHSSTNYSITVDPPVVAPVSPTVGSEKHGAVSRSVPAPQSSGNREGSIPIGEDFSMPENVHEAMTEMHRKFSQSKGTSRTRLSDKVELQADKKFAGAVFRIVLQSGLRRDEADRLMKELEREGFTPVSVVPERDGNFEVAFDNVQSMTIVEALIDDFGKSGYRFPNLKVYPRAQSSVSRQPLAPDALPTLVPGIEEAWVPLKEVPSKANLSNALYRTVVRAGLTRGQAEQLKSHLQVEGYTDVSVVPDTNSRLKVVIGKFDRIQNVENLVRDIRSAGFIEPTIEVSNLLYPSSARRPSRTAHTIEVPAILETRVFDLSANSSDDVPRSREALAEVVEELRRQLQSRAPGSLNRKFWFDEETRLLTVVDYQNNITRIERYLEMPRVRRRLGRDAGNTSYTVARLASGEHVNYMGLGVRVENIIEQPSPNGSRLDPVHAVELLCRTRSSASVETLAPVESHQAGGFIVTLLAIADGRAEIEIEALLDEIVMAPPD